MLMRKTLVIIGRKLVVFLFGGRLDLLRAVLMKMVLVLVKMLRLQQMVLLPLVEMQKVLAMEYLWAGMLKRLVVMVLL